ncbi:D-glycero-beta-D-manno-heptose 1-phosphate adenylyltransferase [Hufsiella ginkgonis]|uniref:D-glycero-beta-D-manno-heptose 1-phosphate adenylyltransferase n=1 Tax=Hufsiella ginkgonis TaxID=2695274 RepID=A0A7K1XSH5_9SPHI|nr:D-glycero-beta-D-manno-heptose 1-phosphate adenylyltransferase [Hufsiella ginkgonis]MXV13963.1 D-glycero-beta-D-manno-heptose 1-phosphate adenylyltransferase [Hufsiella ginkgonis]
MDNLAHIKDKIFSLASLAATVEEWRSNGEKIVFTNGCFDLLHLGHIDYLAKAANLGDKLVIGVNTDRSTSALKGPSRPITNETSRTAMLASFFFVDAVVLFDEPTPYELISIVVPDVLVKGADYTIDQIVGADIVLARGGEVKTLHYLEGYSTSAIERKIRGSK